MTPSALHQHVKDSVCGVISSRNEMGLRLLLESGSTEDFLRDLLVIELTATHHRVSREFPSSLGRVDLVLHNDGTYVEAKQLHLKDGTRYVTNVLRDLRRHRAHRSLGVVYVLDERASRRKVAFDRFGGANRRAVRRVSDIIGGLQRAFSCVYPSREKDALLRRFRGAGHLDLYAFVVSLPEDASSRVRASRDTQGELQTPGRTSRRPNKCR
jgi:hypothetical protein